MHVAGEATDDLMTNPTCKPELTGQARAEAQAPIAGRKPPGMD